MADFEYILKRGVAEIIIADELKTLLTSGRKLRLKEGFDPSFPDIHLGHMVGLRKLRQFQELGHQVVLIVGDWTAQIGDPSGASVTRPMLTAERVRENAETYMKQFFKVVSREKTEVRWQSEWFGKFDLGDVIRLASKFTVAQVLARDDFNERFRAGKPITITETLYPMLQAYDSVMVEADVEFGGTDQKFNLLMGRELQGMVGQKPQQVLMTPLLVGTDGQRKMSKSLGNYIGVSEPSREMYGKLMSVPDDLMFSYFELLTDVPDKELGEMKAAMASGATNPMSLKKRLAREIIGQLHSESAASEAEDYFERTVQKKEVPEDIQEVKINNGLLQKIKARLHGERKPVVSITEVGNPETEEWGVSVPLLLCEIGLSKSRSDARRLVEQGSVRVDGKTVDPSEEEHWHIKIGSIIKVGKRRFVKLVGPDIKS
ncbi:MAG: tyrosine--tRNA ligase [Dehalococcoidia bacterium]|nr:MAG: tyrosine--tRNA ligase [Dehalococcoidia bacterium]